MVMLKSLMDLHQESFALRRNGVTKAMLIRSCWAHLGKEEISANYDPQELILAALGRIEREQAQ